MHGHNNRGNTPRLRQVNPHFLGRSASGHLDIQQLLNGRDVTAPYDPELSRRRAPLGKQEVRAARPWVEERPFEPNTQAGPALRFPRLWTKQRGRYLHFGGVGKGKYALIRGRQEYFAC